jgi:alkylation response protein AidB-like acyl-CoA dehydrogenase
MNVSNIEGDRNNPYTFDDYIFVRDNFDYYNNDEFFQSLVKYYVANEFEEVDRDMRALSKYASFKWRILADKANELENRMKVTKIQHYDAFNHRVDVIERCNETEMLERDIFSLGLFDPNRNTPWSRFCKMFLLYQNGEAGTMCPIACTHGLVWLLQKYESDLSNELKQVLGHVRNGIKGEYARGAQFVSEIQGGSDVPENLVEAVFEEPLGKDGYSNVWRIYGKKFFCSAVHADYALVTAKPKNTSSSTKIAIFAIPAYLPGSKERNSYLIDRLKPKLGTAELPTAEVTYDGAVAYPIGPLEKGLADIVGIVLSISRLHVALGMASGALRVAREATLYAQFRMAFGIPVSNFPMMINQVNDLNHFAQRTAAGAFKIYSEFIHFGEILISGIRDLEKISDLNERKRRFRLRELIMLQKIVVAQEAPHMIRLAISFFGGHGVMEDFLSLPRLHRDSMIMELWEGPRNVLLHQIHRDFARVKDWYKPTEFIYDLLSGAPIEKAEEYAIEFDRIMSHESLLQNDQETLLICREWDNFANKLLIQYQENALSEINYKGMPLKFSKLLRKFKKEKN